MQVENSEDGNKINEKIAENVDQVHQEVVLAHPYLNIEGLHVYHHVDGESPADRDTVAQSKSDQRAHKEAPLFLELSWLEDA